MKTLIDAINQYEDLVNVTLAQAGFRVIHLDVLDSILKQPANNIDLNTIELPIYVQDKDARKFTQKFTIELTKNQSCKESLKKEVAKIVDALESNLEPINY
ncbi:hypothetical protein VIN01S_23020 [Vibrio inusitatus NBRC 102082]|uniref:Uncharacterized protein n=1 Tax=Vibrio inusitatus NBRC 102082 TaxID=1219070 RepID=A0A4Y3HWV7_9VIBR|nr:hypothetical protein [Vibrio inusitatus]GEA51498.1 hypothetical protein VIN01S_23020 [Vibrio inusitatus NBRC 102082]